MRTTLVALLLAGAAAVGGGHPARSAVRNTALTCGGIYCATLPSAEERLAMVAYVADSHGVLPTSCDNFSGADRTGCAVLRGMLADTKRAAAYAAMSKAWSPTRRAAFARLLALHEAYAWAIGESETDRLVATSGADAVAAEQAEKAAFTRTLKMLVAGEGRSVSQVSFTDADDALNATYARVMAVGDTSDLAWGTVEKAGIRRTERAWLAYRDAFVALAATFDGGAASVVKSEVTLHRTARLEDFLAD